MILVVWKLVKYNMNVMFGNINLSQLDFVYFFLFNFCKFVSEYDWNMMVFVFEIIVVFGIGLFYLIMFLLGIFGVCFK